MASSSSSSEAVPPWVELPPEITAAILHKLGTVEILMTAQKVCTTWRRVCRDPAMWRRIHIPKRADWAMFLDWDEIKRAVGLSVAHLTDDVSMTDDVSIELFLDNCERSLRMCIQNCVPWKRADLEKWQRSINIPKRADLDTSLDMDRICRRAMDLSQGHLTHINIECDVSDGLLLLYISERSSQLSHLQLRSSAGMTALNGYCLELAVKSLPLLEELHIYLDFGPHTIYGSVIENIALSCPLLRSFRLNGNLIEHNYDVYDEEALAIAESMPQLRHLQLVGNLMTDKGLRAILDCCLHLESLDLRRCRFLLFAGDLERLCSERIKDLRLPNDPMDDYPFPEDNEYF